MRLNYPRVGVQWCKKEDFGETYTEVDFLKAKFDVTVQFPPKRAEPRGIPKSKKTGILNLLRVAPAASG